MVILHNMKYLLSFLFVGFSFVSLIAQTQIGSNIDGQLAGDKSGHSVSISGDGTVLAVAAPGHGYVGNQKGRVKVYQYSSGIWSQLGADIVGEAINDASGHSISLSGDGTVLAIGAPGNDDSGNQIGHVRVYEYNSGTWSQLGSDIIGEAAGDISGFAVSLSGDGAVLAIGAAGNDDSGIIAGHTRIYKYHSGAWSQIGVDIDGDAQGDQSGGSVSLSHDGTVVAIGAARNDENGNQAGRVKVYDLTHTTGIDDLTKYNPISIFPNPTKGYIYSEAFVTGDLIAVYNAVGKEVMHIENVSAKINVSNLNRGTYFILVISEHGIGYNNFLKL